MMINFTSNGELLLIKAMEVKIQNLPNPYAHNLKWVAGIPCFLIAFAAAIRGLMRARRQKHPTTS